MKSADKNVEKEVFCINCGSRLNGRSNNCTECGYSSGVSAVAITVERSDKCPNCGDNIPSFTVICPSCGSEISSADVPSAIKEFSNSINKLDNTIASNSHKQYWESWAPLMREFWVGINVILIGIPHVLYLFYRLIKPAPFNAAESKKAQYINNFTFPNDRESILEGLLYIRSTIAALCAKKTDRNTLQWVKLWKNKATYLFEKAEIMFRDDKIAHDAYAAVLKSEKKLKNVLLIKILIPSVLLVSFIFYASTSHMFGPKKADVTNTPNTFAWPTSGLALELPEPPTNVGKIRLNDDRELWLEMNDIRQSQFERYVQRCKNNGFTIESKKTGYSYEAYNEKGYFLSLFHHAYIIKDTLSLHIKAPLPMDNIMWPESDIAKLLPIPKSSCGYIESESLDGFVIYIGEMTKDDFGDYADACYEAGFKKNHTRSDKSFTGYDMEGNYVELQYMGNKTVSIKIQKP